MTVGTSIDWSAEIERDVREKGCIAPRSGNAYPAGVGEAVNLDPVYDATRRLATSMVRFVNRRQFVSYAVANGKSILRLRRYVQGPNNAIIDAFAGIAGAIAHTAPAGGWTNEWVMLLQTHVMGLGAGNLYKPDAYGDYFTFNQRALFRLAYGGTLTFSRHVNYNYSVGLTEVEPGVWRRQLNGERVQTSYLSPEAPDGYRYAEGANGNLGDLPSVAFYRSCRIYEPPAEIESAELENKGQIVKLTFTGRLRSHEDAKETVDPDAATWSDAEIASLREEDYRTDDNALREYALQIARGTTPSWKVGDAAWHGSMINKPTRTSGSVLPHFVFVKLIPEPSEDGNDRNDDSDTRCTIDQLLQAEITLRAACEGFVDVQSTARLNDCEKSGEYCNSAGHGLYDFTWENLGYQAHGNRWIPALSLAVRADNPPAHGPLPRTRMYADTFNALASGVDLLTEARVMLPFSLQTKRTTLYGTSATFDDSQLDPVCGFASGATLYHGAMNANFPKPDTIGPPTDTEWQADTQVEAVSSGYLQVPSVGAWSLGSLRRSVQWRLALVDPNAAEAIPEAWRERIVAGDLSSMFCRYYDDRFVTHLGVGSGPAECAGFNPFSCDLTVHQNAFAECVWKRAGTEDMGRPRDGWTFLAVNGAAACEFGSQTYQLLTPLQSDPPVAITIPLVDQEPVP